MMTVKAAAVAVITACLCGCAFPITSWSYERVSPNARYRAVVQVIGLKPHRLEVILDDGRERKLIFSRDYSEVYVGFCELSWSEDSRTAEMLATNPIEAGDSGDAVFGYDVDRGQVLRRDQVLRDITRRIADTYQLPASMDPVSWAHTQAAQDLFHETNMTVGRH